MRTPHYIVAGFVSEAPTPLNVTLIVGALCNPANTAEVYFNLSTVSLHQTLTAYDALEAANELTLEFPWSVPQDLPKYPFPMQLIVTVYYMSDGNKPFSNTLHNGTVFFVAKSEPFNVFAVLPHALTLALLALFALLFPAAFPETAALFKLAAPLEAKKVEAPATKRWFLTRWIFYVVALFSPAAKKVEATAIEDENGEEFESILPGAAKKAAEAKKATPKAK